MLHLRCRHGDVPAHLASAWGWFLCCRRIHERRVKVDAQLRNCDQHFYLFIFFTPFVCSRFAECGCSFSSQRRGLSGFVSVKTVIDSQARWYGHLWLYYTWLVLYIQYTPSHSMVSSTAEVQDTTTTTHLDINCSKITPSAKKPQLMEINKKKRAKKHTGH